MVRGMKAFCRYADWNPDGLGPANVYVLDLLDNAAWTNAQRVLEVASRDTWAVVVAVLTEPKTLPVREWVSGLLFNANRHRRNWVVFTPKQFRFPQEISAISGVTVHSHPDLAYGEVPLPDEGSNDVFESLEQLVEPYLWGKLSSFPRDLKTWEQVAHGLATHGYTATPLRHAAKYGDLQHIPPESCAQHFEEAKSIVIKSVEDSRIDGRFRRRVEARRWLVKVALAAETVGDGKYQLALGAIDELVVEAVAAGSPPAVFGEAAGSCAVGAEDLLRQYVATGNDAMVDSAIAERFLDRITTFEEPTAVITRGFNRKSLKKAGIPASQMELGFDL
jgi:hypothetical protein